MIDTPSSDEVRRIARELGFSLSAEEIEVYRGMVDYALGLYRGLDSLPEHKDHRLVPRYARSNVRRPTNAENPYNAWYYCAEIRGAASGKLAGRRVAIKDNVLVAGIPMMNGSASLDGYVPDIDATLVSRILDAGGIIAGKSNCEAYCLSCSSFTGAAGAVMNPRKPGYSAGGSSSGSAALVAAAEVDLAIGTDQGGSIRMPSSFCGTYGMKPTFGLVPYTGLMSIDVGIDHAGPITGNVADNALLLEVIAGPDGIDPRQPSWTPMPYSTLLHNRIAGLRIGVLKEGFGHANSEADVDEQVRAAAATLGSLGAVVSDVSVPEHLSAAPLWFPIATGGATNALVDGDAYGVSPRDYYALSLMSFHRNWRATSQQWPVTAKVFTLTGRFIEQTFGQRYYAKASNLVRRLRAAYDAALANVDVLLMPSTPMKATKLPQADTPLPEQLSLATTVATNTLPFNLTGHPAMSLPCATSEDLPIGLMLVGRHFDELTLYRTALAFETHADWQKRRA